MPVDVSRDFLEETAIRLREIYPQLSITTAVGDFTRQLKLPLLERPSLFVFLGSTIGNFEAESAIRILRRIAAQMRPEDRFLLGVDLRKDERLIEAAYNDAAGVTAEFNLNLIERINRELGGTIPLDAFVHEVRWNDMLGRIEMHLAATRDVDFEVEGQPFRFAKGATIHTENSHKYGPRGGRLLLLAGGWTPLAEWTDPDEDFALVLAEAQPNRFAP